MQTTGTAGGYDSDRYQKKTILTGELLKPSLYIGRCEQQVDACLAKATAFAQTVPRSICEGELSGEKVLAAADGVKQ